LVTCRRRSGGISFVIGYHARIDKRRSLELTKRPTVQSAQRDKAPRTRPHAKPLRGKPKERPMGCTGDDRPSATTRGRRPQCLPLRYVRLDAYQAQVIRTQYASPVGWAPEVEDEMVEGVCKVVTKSMLKSDFKLGCELNPCRPILISSFWSAQRVSFGPRLRTSALHRLCCHSRSLARQALVFFFVDLSGTASVNKYLKERFRHPKTLEGFGSTDHDFMEPHIYGDT